MIKLCQECKKRLYKFKSHNLVKFLLKSFNKNTQLNAHVYLIYKWWQTLMIRKFLMPNSPPYHKRTNDFKRNCSVKDIDSTRSLTKSKNFWSRTNGKRKKRSKKLKKSYQLILNHWRNSNTKRPLDHRNRKKYTLDKSKNY